MRELGSCVAPISGEHLISQSVMQVLQGNGEFSIAGVPWLQPGEVRVLGANALRANCLCTKHNSSLSPIDGAAKHLFQSLKAYLEEDAGEPRHSLVSGHDLERWVLKTAKALAVSGNLARGEERLFGAFAQDSSLIAMLDTPAAWPTGAGLYCMMNEGDLMLNHSRFQLVPWVETADGGDVIVALQVSILGFIFVLLLEPLDPERYPVLAAAKYRPGADRDSASQIDQLGDDQLGGCAPTRYVDYSACKESASNGSCRTRGVDPYADDRIRPVGPQGRSEFLSAFDRSAGQPE